MKNRSELNRQINEIINDKTSGSTELLIKLSSLVYRHLDDEKAVRTILSRTKKNLSHFAIISSYILEVEKLLGQAYPDRTKNLDKFGDQAGTVKEIYHHAKPLLQEISIILTLSNSRTVSEFIKLWKKDVQALKVILCESRPKLEGRKLAAGLLKSKIKTEFITDASLGIFIPQCDAVFVGADSVLKNGNIINKTGSLSAAVLCNEFGKPFYVIAQGEKYSSLSAFKQKEEPPAEVWNKKDRNLKVRNLYFEEVDKKYITKILK